jgi:hypothetical protein
MMKTSIKIRPVNSLLFISDLDGGAAPVPIRGAMILSTPSCISFRCFPEQDGPTEVMLGKADTVDPGDQPAFDGELATPNRAITISTVEGATVLQAKVSDTRTHVRIWLNDLRSPDKVIIGWG